jgi:NADH-quinone oxidoreductase subunit G
VPTFKLDGKAVEFRPGEMIIEAAARAGVAVPYYCYHPDMSRPANCRMCLVEMVGAPKLITACSWPVNEKMEILTDSEKVRSGRANVMEFLLINHPLDCPICDQAGECKLQQYSYLFGKPASAMEEPKVNLDKRKVLGPHVVLDQERCISCTRCVRFCDEIVGTGELAMVHRGNRSTVDIHAGRHLDNAYSGCVVDMCPVGALTNRDFRFEARVWYLQATSSTCTLCSRGCNILVDWRGERRGLPDVKRIRARRNPAVNAAWMCDEGRFAPARVREGRRPVRATGGEAADPRLPYARLDATLQAAAALLRPHAGRRGWLGVLASASETNEELAAIAALARAADPEALLVVPEAPEGGADALLRRKDKAANAAGARRLGFAPRDLAELSHRKVVLLADADLRPDGGLQAEGVKALQRSAAGVALVAHERPWLRSARVVLPLANAFEKDGTIVSFEGVLQRVTRAVPPPGDCRPLQRHASDIAAAAGLAPVEADAAAWLLALCSDGPFAGLDPARLGPWGARLGAPGSGKVEYVEAPPESFGAAPAAFAEGEYAAFVPGSVAPPAVHVAAGAPTRIRVEHGGTGDVGSHSEPAASAGGGA